MSWLAKVFKGSSHRDHGRYTDDQVWDRAHSSTVMTISAFYAYFLVGPAHL